MQEPLHRKVAKTTQCVNRKHVVFTAENVPFHTQADTTPKIYLYFAPMDCPMEENPHFQASVTAVRQLISTWPDPLRGRASDFFERQLHGIPMQIITLLPYLVHELIPTPTAALAPLSEAHLLAAWYYHAQDDLLDEQHDPTVMLGAHIALLEAIRRYEQLGLATAACWPQFFALAQRASQAYTQEWLGRFTQLNQLTADQLAPFTPEFIRERAAPLFFNTQPQLELAGIPAHDERVQNLLHPLQILNLCHHNGC